MTRFRRLLLACALLGVARDGNLSADEKTVVESTASVSHTVAKSTGLCLLVGIRPEIAAECQANPQLLIHALDRDIKREPSRANRPQPAGPPPNCHILFSVAITPLQNPAARYRRIDSSQP